MREVVLDIETQREFAEVGGRDNVAALGVSLVGVYDSAHDSLLHFKEQELHALQTLLLAADRVIGFNIKYFDFPVLQPYLSTELSRLPVVDIMDDVVKGLGFRVSLESLARANLGEGKSGKGLEAIQWYRMGEWDKLIRYCLDDVRLTRDLYEYGKMHGKLQVASRGGFLSIPVSWRGPHDMSIRELLAHAQRSGRQLEIEYLSSSGDGDAAPRTTRAIEIRTLEDDRIEAYCHLQNGIRRFLVSKILRARMLESAPSMQSLF